MEDRETKEDLAYAYRVLAYLKMDDHTYTHLSARSENGLFMYPFGMLFQDVTSESLLEIDFDGEVLKGKDWHYNKTGYMIHGSVYKVRQDVQAIFHIHTPEIVAVSCEELRPLSQWALHFYDRVAYHPYDSLALEGSQGEKLAQDLKHYDVMLMRNHGALICGRTIQEAMFYTYHLQKACHTQCLIHASHPYSPSPETCQKAREDLLSFESNLGYRDWKAWKSLKLI